MMYTSAFFGPHYHYTLILGISFSKDHLNIENNEEEKGCHK